MILVGLLVGLYGVYTFLNPVMMFREFKQTQVWTGVVCGILVFAGLLTGFLVWLGRRSHCCGCMQCGMECPIYQKMIANGDDMEHVH